MKSASTTVADMCLRQVMSDLSLQYAQAPLHRITFTLDDGDLQRLTEHYQDRIFRLNRHLEEGTMTTHVAVLRFEDDVYVFLGGWGQGRAVIYAPTAERADALCAEIRAALHPAGAPEKAARPFFYMLRFDSGDFSTDRIEGLPEAVDDDFLRLCYGDDVLAWTGRFAETTSARPGGITILEGAPGTGKTSLLTQLMHRFAATHVFYALPNSHNQALASPEMTPFWQGENAKHGSRVKVIILEDADRLLWRRGGDNREAVSSLLNIADGLLGRMLRLHVVCSVNSAMDDIDPAILRPGRLMNYRHFAPLGRAAALRLAALRGVAFEPDPDEEEFALADVLNPRAYEPVGAKARLGF